MASETNTPDSWEQNDTPDPSMAEKLAALNVNAAEFVPGKNIHAKEFIPTYAVPSDNEINESSPPREDSQNQEITDNVPPDDWANKDQEEPDEEDKGVAEDRGGAGDPPEGASQEEEGEPESSNDNGTNVPVPRPSSKTKVQPNQEEEYEREHINVIFIGHVDAGKSTIGGHLMYLTGMVEKRTLEKYEKEAKEKNRETWYLSWALDTNQEERDKGKTVEVGRAYFETDNKHFTILDAPGHKSFVPNMIGGASQADLAVLVISARKGEFETGFERGGQTREHAMLAKTAGVRHLIVLINKMDDPTVEWHESRFIECREKLIPYLKKCGFNPKTDLHFMPVSGLTGAFLKTRPEGNICTWYNGPTFIQYLEELPPFSRDPNGPVRVPLVDRYKDMGIIALGKVESGTITKGMSLIMMPNKVTVDLLQLWSDDIETDKCRPGENIKIKLKNIEEEDVSPGFTLCSAGNLCHTAKVFDAQIVILEHKSIICAGYGCIIHIHGCAEEVTIRALICTVDKKTGEKSKTRPRFVKQDQIAIARFALNAGMICMETFKDFPQMGRFTLRDEGKTIAIGKVLKVIE